MSVGFSNEDQIGKVESLRSDKLPESSRVAEVTPRLAVAESQIEVPEPFVRRRSPVGSKCRAPPGSTTDPDPIDHILTPEE